MLQAVRGAPTASECDGERGVFGVIRVQRAWAVSMQWTTLPCVATIQTRSGFEAC